LDEADGAAIGTLDGGGDRGGEADECAGNPPKKSPEEKRNQHHER
jgi:hypothetical protein